VEAFLKRLKTSKLAIRPGCRHFAPEVVVDQRKSALH
jgi:hypothetical protein